MNFHLDCHFQAKIVSLDPLQGESYSVIHPDVQHNPRVFPAPIRVAQGTVHLSFDTLVSQCLFLEGKLNGDSGEMVLMSCEHFSFCNIDRH